MILVAGGTGRLGREVATRLTASDRDVRVLTRHAAHADGLDVEVSIGDVRDPSTLTAALRGVSVVISAVHGFLGGRGAGPEQVDLMGNRNLLRASRDAGVDHFVLLSVLDARPDHPMALHRAKYAAEQLLRNSELSWTVLRPSSYIETWIDIVGSKLASGGPALVFGRGDNPINFISVQDVATITERAITDPALRGRVIDVPGLDNLTMGQLAQHLGAQKVRHIPRGALRFFSTVLAPVAPAFARQARAAVVMDSVDLTANATVLCAEFPGIAWHPAIAVAEEFHVAPGHTP